DARRRLKRESLTHLIVYGPARAFGFLEINEPRRSREIKRLPIASLVLTPDDIQLPYEGIRCGLRVNARTAHSDRKLALLQVCCSYASTLMIEMLYWILIMFSNS